VFSFRANAGLVPSRLVDVPNRLFTSDAPDQAQAMRPSSTGDVSKGCAGTTRTVKP